MSNKKLIVIFPGRNYSTDCPLLYYASFKYEVLGYEEIAISYGDVINEGNTIENCIENIKNIVLLRLQEANLSQYDDIVFVSKSLGTVIAGWVEEKLGIEARHIYLTPLTETLPYIKKGKKIITVIAGTEDKFLDADILKEHCINENISLKQIEGVGHRLEVWGDMNKNIELLKEIVSFY